MKDVIAQALPELVEFGFTDSRVCPLSRAEPPVYVITNIRKLCWYTDSIDNNVSNTTPVTEHLIHFLSMSLTMFLATPNRFLSVREARK
jgi:hypothetical protein